MTDPDQRDPKQCLPLQPHVLQILLSVLRRGRHGYAIIHDVAERTAGGIVLGTSTLYSTIKRMVTMGLLSETSPPADEPSTDTRRRYYQATEFGCEVARAEARRIRELDAMLEGADLLAGGERSGP